MIAGIGHDGWCLMLVAVFRTDLKAVTGYLRRRQCVLKLQNELVSFLFKS